MPDRTGPMSPAELLRAYDTQLRQIARQDPRITRVMTLNGLGEISAGALVASVGNGHAFKNGRQFAAWLGLVPGQYSSGGKPRLGRITKAGDAYLRSLLVWAHVLCWPWPPIVKTA